MRFYLTIAIIRVASLLGAQEITDSIHTIEGVEIRSQRLFIMEEAGMRQSHVDTVVLAAKASANLSELLSENTPVFIKSNGRGAMATASFRGTAASHTQVSWNGMSLNSPMLGMVDFSLIPVYLVDELNLRHGSASITDRGGGIGGSISLENAPDWQEPFGGCFIQGLGSYRTYDEFLQVEGGGQKLRFSTRIYHNQSKNNYTFLNRAIADIDPVSGELSHPVDTNDHADYGRYGILQELYWRPVSNHLVSLTYWGQYADRAIPWPTSYEGPDNANLNRQEQADHHIILRWKAYTPAGNFSARSGVARRRMDYIQWKRVPGLGSISDVASLSSTHSLQNQLAWEKEWPGSWSLEAKVDADYHRVDTRDTVTGVGYEEDRTELSLFAALRKSFADRLNLNLMLRQEWIDGAYSPLIPFLGMDFKLLENKDLVLKASLARNFHHPSLNDLYWQPGGNPDLEAEEGFSLEGGLAWSEQLGKHLLESSLNFYRSDIRNWIIWIPSANMYLDPINVERVLTYGAELDARVKGRQGPWNYMVSGSYAWTPSINLGDPLVWGDASYGKQLPYVPLHSGNLFLNLGFGPVYLTYQWNAYSERYTTSSNDPGNLGWLYPYFMNDLSGGVRLDMSGVELDVELKVYNLFNESYHSVLYRPMPGRNYLLVIKVRI